MGRTGMGLYEGTMLLRDVGQEQVSQIVDPLKTTRMYVLKIRTCELFHFLINRINMLTGFGVKQFFYILVFSNGIHANLRYTKIIVIKLYCTPAYKK
ncbi:hypothetical protein [Bacillus andreraoultii]|uniref:hypothetical protein n=1 Tax=Bacillus andreraoultii TaxID=1499685 RepID=UPI001112190E|nr:hypothetical protein [Bacillus andreraoultii]